jgi:hypothetical protein
MNDKAHQCRLAENEKNAHDTDQLNPRSVQLAVQEIKT